MSKFKAGDKVRCLDDLGTANLKTGRAYRVLQSMFFGTIDVITEWGPGTYCEERFEKVSPNGKKQ